MFLNNMDSEEIYDKLTNRQKDELYRLLLKDHVKQDIEQDVEYIKKNQYEEIDR
jgi:hypothetical protein